MEAGADGEEEGTEELYGLFPISRCEMNDHPTHPAHNTAAITTPANTFPNRSSSALR